MTSKVMAFILAIFFFTASCQTRNKNCIYLIPKDYEGNVLIVFDQTDGKKPEYESENRLYRIDSTGVLKTQFKVDRNVKKAQFYSIDNQGNRAPIELYNNLSQPIADSNNIFCAFIQPGHDFDQKRKVDRFFESFLISRVSNMDSIGNQRSNFIWDNLD